MPNKTLDIDQEFDDLTDFFDERIISIRSSQIGRKKTAMTIAKMKQAAQAKVTSEEWRSKQALARQKRASDEKLKQEISRKISQRRKGQKPSQQAIEKSLATRRQNGYKVWNKGLSHSTATKEKLRLANLGKTISLEQREKIRQAQLNLSQESQLKKAQANQGKNARPIHTPIGTFASKEQAVIAYGMTNYKFSKLMKENPSCFYYLNNRKPWTPKS